MLALVIGDAYIRGMIETRPVTPHGARAATDQRRTADLTAAKACEARGDWACALRYAESAMAADSSSKEAKELRDKIALMQLGIDKPAAAAGTNAVHADCVAGVRVQRIALRKHDQTVDSANEVISALSLCPEAAQLERDATRVDRGAVVGSGLSTGGAP